MSLTVDGENQSRKIRKIILHHSAGSPFTTPDVIDAEHRKRGFAKAGYHRYLWSEVVSVRGGSVVSTRCVQMRHDNEIGAHDQGENADSIGICRAGHYAPEAPGYKGDILSEGDKNIIAGICATYCKKYGLDADDIYGHNENEPASTPTACPGYDVEEIRQRVRKLLMETPA